MISSLILFDHGSFMHCNGTSSVIDLTISSVVMTTNLLWETPADLHNSYHYPIFVTNMNFRSNTDIWCPKRWLPDKTHWTKYTCTCNLRNLNLDQYIDNVILKLNQTLVLTAKKSVPQSSEKPHRREVPWWYTEIKDAISNRKIALKKFRNTRLKLI